METAIRFFTVGFFLRSDRDPARRWFATTIHPAEDVTPPVTVEALGESIPFFDAPDLAYAFAKQAPAEWGLTVEQVEEARTAATETLRSRNGRRFVAGNPTFDGDRVRSGQFWLIDDFASALTKR
ncbi:MAG TPA: hypothetical protein VGN57_14075 [Pirellulaceae bacterium]|jgi:hypothetical protein|nr:hypothetical protein [Pirellulaceae bacterium]